MLALVLVSFAGCSVQRGLSLKPPHEFSDVGEMGNWTVRGAALNFKQFIRLTSSQPEQYGAVCNRVPTNFRDWRLELQVNAWGGDGGNGFEFIFSEEPCPDQEAPFTGFVVTIAADESEDLGELVFSPLYISDHRLTPEERNRTESMCSVPVRSDDELLELVITRKGNNVSVSYADDEREEGDWGLLCASLEMKDLAEYGYITVSASTGKDGDDDHDLYFVNMLSESVETSYDKDYSQANRKIIEGFVETRREKKMRRRANMPLMQKYRAEQMEAYKLSDALGLVNEMHLRAQMVVSKTYIGDFIDASIDEKLKKANEKIAFAMASFENLKEDLDAIWTGINQSLIDVTEEAQGQVDMVIKDVMSYANILGTGGENSPLYRTAYGDALVDMEDPVISTIFIGICICEAVVYLVFVLIRLRKTQFFKKAN